MCEPHITLTFSDLIGAGFIAVIVSKISTYDRRAPFLGGVDDSDGLDPKDDVGSLHFREYATHLFDRFPTTLHDTVCGSQASVPSTSRSSNRM